MKTKSLTNYNCFELYDAWMASGDKYYPTLIAWLKVMADNDKGTLQKAAQALLESLTPLQIDVFARMVARGDMDFIAAATVRHWLAGEPYCIDRRCDTRGIRRDFERANKQATEVSNA